MSIALNSNLMQNSLATTSAILGNSLNGMNNLNSGLGLGVNSLVLNGGLGGLGSLNGQNLNGLGFGLNGVGGIGSNLFSNPNSLLSNPAYFLNLGFCQRCTTQCPSGTSCNNGICRASKLQGYIPNPNHVRVYRDCDRSNYYYHGRRSHGRRHHH